MSRVIAQSRCGRTHARACVGCLRAACLLWCLWGTPGISLGDTNDSDGNGEGLNPNVVMTRDVAGVFRLQVEQASWDQVFTEVATKAGVQVHYLGLPPILVSAVCVGPSIKHIVECLLGPGANVIFRYAADEPLEGLHQADAVEAWVGLNARSTTLCTQAADLPEQGRPVSPAEARAAEPDPKLTETLERLAGSEDPTERISALSQLAVDKPVDPGVVEEILLRALEDEDPNVRGQAVYALAQRGGVESAEVVREALQDDAAAVRRMAVDGLTANEESITLFKQALVDSDQAVRELAAMKLEPLSNLNEVP